MLSQIQRRVAVSGITRGTAAIAAAGSSVHCSAAVQSFSAVPRRPLSVRSRSLAPRVTVAAEIPNVSDAPIRVAIKRDEKFARVSTETQARHRMQSLACLVHSRLIPCDAVLPIVRSQLTAEDVDHFRSIVGTEGLVQDETQLQLYNNDWMKKFRQSCALRSAVILCSALD